MPNIFVVSDTHFGHANIIRYCNRPFSSVEEMNEKMIDNWNQLVTIHDHVYHLGDVYFGSETSNFFHRLNGKKRLILGNHDNGKDQKLRNMFQKISMWRMFPEFKVLLTHVPVHPMSLSEKAPINIHGHIHEKDVFGNQYRNVSVEKINYTPISLEEIRDNA